MAWAILRMAPSPAQLSDGCDLHDPVNVRTIADEEAVERASAAHSKAGVSSTSGLILCQDSASTSLTNSSPLTNVHPEPRPAKIL